MILRLLRTRGASARPRLYSTVAAVERAAETHIDRTRNIGIIAHIDAGKTTTTERMLYYSGLTRRIGDVDEGSTVTDFLPAERARGITIQSAAITFRWPPAAASTSQLSSIPHTINLIDTPGHADFTFEVLRSLRILDGAVCVLDGVAGVEAQTEKVWAQANTYNIPRIVFVNKLDRDGAAFGRTVKEVASRLHGWPAVCHVPWFEGAEHKFTGIGDAINLCALKWGDGDGKQVQHLTLEQLAAVDASLADEVTKARAALVEVLCEFDEQLLETWLEGEDSLAVPAQDIWDSLRRCVLDGQGRLIPVFAGASFRNMGVQPLLDAINNLLPNPSERPHPEVRLGPVRGTLTELLNHQLVPHEKKSTAVAHLEACALAFKVVHDARRGVLVYVRVYSGSINRNAPLWNTNLHVTERAQRLLQMYASDAVELSSIPAGQIGVIAGLKHARTGDTLIAYPGVNPKVGPPAPLRDLQLRPIDVPPPVFFAAVEPHSLAEEKNVADILGTLLREDPSLHVSVDEDSGQMLLSGMGELHLEIARDRLVKDFKAKATMGGIEIGYRETVMDEMPPQHVVFDREIAGKRGKAGCTATLAPLEAIADAVDGNRIMVDMALDDATPLPADLPFEVMRAALVNGATAALARGPRRMFALHSTDVRLQFAAGDLFGADTTPAALASAARLAVQTALKQAAQHGQVAFMEPVMNVVIACDEASLGAIVHDLSAARGGHVQALGDEVEDVERIDLARVYAPRDPFASTDVRAGPGQQRQVTARVPLKEMVGYLKHLRSITGGRGTFVMTFDRFERVVGVRERSM